MRVKLGAQAKPAKYTKWDFTSATKETIASMNKDIEDNIAKESLKAGRPTDIWSKLSSTYLQAIERNIPKASSKPRKPWISQSTLDLLEERGRLRQQGDMVKVTEWNRDIRKAAKRDKRNWLDGQLQSGDWGPIGNLRKPFRTQVLSLRATIRQHRQRQTQTSTLPILRMSSGKRQVRPRDCPIHRCLAHHRPFLNRPFLWRSYFWQ